jgi:hypothetical protein
VASFCEGDNELFIKDGEFLDQLSDCKLLKKDSVNGIS